MTTTPEFNADDRVLISADRGIPHQYHYIIGTILQWTGGYMSVNTQGIRNEFPPDEWERMYILQPDDSDTPLLAGESWPNLVRRTDPKLHFVPARRRQRGFEKRQDLLFECDGSKW